MMNFPVVVRFLGRFAILFILIIIGGSVFAQNLKLIIPKGHTNPVTGIVCSPDKKYVASTDGTNELTIWDYNTAKEISRYALGNSVTTMFMDSKSLLIGQKDGSLSYLNLNTLLLSDLDPVTSSSIVYLNKNDNQFIAISFSGSIIYLNDEFEKVDSLKLELPLVSAIEDNENIFIGTVSGSLITFKKQTNVIKTSLELGESQINDLAISPSGNSLVTSDNRGFVYHIDIKSNQLLNTYHVFTLRARRLDFLNEYQIMVAGRDDQSNLKVIDLTTGDIRSKGLWKDETSYKLFPYGLFALNKLDNNNIFIAGYQNNFWLLDSLDNGINFTGEAGEINDIALDKTGKKLAIGGDHSQLAIINLSGRTNPKVFETDDLPTSLKWLDKELFVGLSNGDILKIDKDSSSMIKPGIKLSYPDTKLEIDSTGVFSLRKYSANGIPLIRLDNLKVTKNLKKAGFSYAFHPRNQELLFLNSKKQIEIWSLTKLKKIKSLPVTDVLKFNITRDGNIIIAQQRDNLLLIDYESAEVIKSWNQKGVGSGMVAVSPDLSQIYVAKASRKKGSITTDYLVSVIDASSGTESHQLTRHNAMVTDIEFVKNGNYILTGSADGSIKIWEKDGKYSGEIIPLKNGEHVIIAANGLFDATPLAMEKLGYLQGTEVIQLNQVKSKYYEPGLLSKLLGFNKDPIRHADPLSHVKLYPEFELIHPLYNEGRLGIKIISREGGTGRVIVLINGKEVNDNILPSEEGYAEYDVMNHPYILTGGLNRISVKVQNADGDAESSPRNLYFLDKRKPEDIKPHLYGLVVGVSDYHGEDLDLKYAAEDANDISNAIELSAKEFLGEDYVHIKRITTLDDTSSVSWPSKANIEKAFKEIAQKATARDILFLYMSGHGVVDKDNSQDFYYLTADAGYGELEDTTYRNEAYISNVELIRMIQEIAALKQVLVVDACHSGSLVSSFSNSSSPTMSSTQVRSLEKIKDHAGMYVLAGSAADAVSYESTMFGQGLLTYSLLMGMKGPALRDNKFVDILSLFNYASNEVPELASEIGGIQKPEIKIPSAGSFDIGMLNNENKKMIEINSPKPIFIHSSFQHETRYLDFLNLGQNVDEQLRHLEDLGDSEIVFLNSNDYPDAYSIRGRYTLTNNVLMVKVKLFKGYGQVGDFEVSTDQINSGSELIVQEVIKRLKPVISSEL